MTVQFHPDAELEFKKAIEYYEQQERGLGIKFSGEVKRVLERIRINPTAWTSISKNLRRSLTNRFPYGILYHYSEANNIIYVVAVMHLHKEPKYWRDRME
ncbi:type II toxin-antitoxin system RelE/ParE family toxin [Rhodohalobacter barkolensis]|uniref:Plasmid stabilization protein n=1 Tax=Rhodohalobacter barkolensis TaxID=2053187 RepID=A0A2N0VKC7_9BACT|nr:type II toxin-antitoxin system RelE/ParE family toxin [Rhodohalobacter barkolensis]PKD44642.1 plasmid stabilization protein [Rhodohalobacter barkolensis]